LTLPIAAILADLVAALDDAPNAVLIAPPGAGKTTAVAPALLDRSWCTGQIFLLSPRRIAARAAAERMAELAGETVGGRIGYATRMDARQGPSTRILVLTEGIFRNRIIADPELNGVSAVLFDEVHERSLDSDFGLALALEAQAALRPDLRLVAMSATLDGDRFAALMNDAPVLVSEGISHPLTLHHIGRNAAERIEDDMARAIRRALTDEAQGDILAFLPGVREIERTTERLAGLPHAVLPLHGTLDPAQQRAALRPDADGRRKIILATSIAETSLTIDGVRIVIDSGLARRARFDVAVGMSRLVTERASQAAATQRAGRAARQGPGVAYRLWEEAATGGMARFDPPEITEADLAPLLLDCAAWGERDPARLAWLDPPPAPALAEARARLVAMGALDTEGRLTTHGRAIAKLPLPPALAHMLIAGADIGVGAESAEAAVLLSERGLGGNDIDLDRRLSRWRGERGQRADAARRLAKRWADMLLKSEGGSDAANPLATALALAFPDRIARRRDASGEQWQSVGGRGYRLEAGHPLGANDWIVIGDAQGAASGARIAAAVAIDFAAVEQLYADRIDSGTSVRFDPATGGVRTESGRRLGAITLSTGQDAKADPAAIAAALLDGVRDHGLDLLPFADTTQHLRSRAAFAGMTELGDQALLENLGTWLAPLLVGKRRLSDIDMGTLQQALRNQLDWDAQQRLDRIVPAYFAVPSGGTHFIDYDAPAGPTVTLRVQALFGLTRHPTVGADRIPLILSLTSPAGRPIQTTRDLPGFWAGSWADVAKEMRGRYPRHNWPDDPTSAVASLKTKKALAKKS
jgi:ATP-dependent helicase HrpB